MGIMINTIPWIEEILPAEYETISEACRSSDEVLASYLAKLRANPGRRLAWSWHQSRGAARQRVNNLRHSALFENNPDIQFETRSVLQGSPDRGVYILIFSDDASGQEV